MPLGDYLGRRDREHLARWHAALMAGRRAAPSATRSRGMVALPPRPSLPAQTIAATISMVASADAIDLARRRTSPPRDRPHELRGSSEACRAPTAEYPTPDASPGLVEPPGDRRVHAGTLSAEEERVRACLRDEFGLDIEAADTVTGGPSRRGRSIGRAGPDTSASRTGSILKPPGGGS